MRYKLIASTIAIIVFAASGNIICHLGHTTEITLLNSSGDFLASQDSWWNWSVWDIRTRQQILSGRLDTNRMLPKVSLKNGVFIVPCLDGFWIYHLPDVTPSTVEADSVDSLRLTSDGKFIWSCSKTSLRVWDANGAQVLKLAGNHLQSSIVSDSSKLYIANKGMDSLVIISQSDFNERSSCRFEGTFHSWMMEGQRFLTLQGTIIRIYSATGARESMHDLEITAGLSCYGSYFWTYPAGVPDNNLRIYKVENSDVPVKTIECGVSATVECKNGFLGICPYGIDSIVICKLGRDSITMIKNEGAGPYISAFESDLQGTWYSGNQSGVINYANNAQQPRCLNYGRVRALAGTPDGKLAAATSSKKILIFQCNDSSATLMDSIDHNSSALQFSDDGAILASQTNTFDDEYTPYASSLYLFNTETHGVIRNWIFSNDHNFDSLGRLFDFDLSKNGAVVGLRIGMWKSENTHFEYFHKTYRLDRDSAVLVVPDNYTFNSLYVVSLQLSPDGSFSAIIGDSIVKIYRDNELINACNGKMGGWYDTGKFIMNKYRTVINPEWKWGPQTVWAGTYLTDTSCTLDSSLKFPSEIFKSTFISDSEAFAPDHWPGFTSGWSMYNVHSGRKVFSTMDLSPQRVPYPLATNVGSDFVIYQTLTTLNTINWRQNQSAVHQKVTTTPRVTISIGMNRSNVKISFSLKKQGFVTFTIFSLRGELINSRSVGNCSAGFHSLTIPLKAIFGNCMQAANPVVIALKTDNEIIGYKKMFFLK